MTHTVSFARGSVLSVKLKASAWFPTSGEEKDQQTGSNREATDRQTDRQTDCSTEARQTDSIREATDRPTDRPTAVQKLQTDRQTDRPTAIRKLQTDRQTDSNKEATDRQTDRPTTIRKLQERNRRGVDILYNTVWYCDTFCTIQFFTVTHSLCDVLWHSTLFTVSFPFGNFHSASCVTSTNLKYVSLNSRYFECSSYSSGSWNRCEDGRMEES